MTAAQLEKALQVAATLLEVIAASGPTGIPSGHLYAATMNAFADVGSYEACVRMLVKSGLVRRDGLLLIACVRVTGGES